MLEKELTSSKSNSRVTKLSVALIVLNTRFTLAPDSPRLKRVSRSKLASFHVSVSMGLSPATLIRLLTARSTDCTNVRGRLDALADR